MRDAGQNAGSLAGEGIKDTLYFDGPHGAGGGTPPLVFVHLGSKLPGYALDSLAIARKNFSGRILLLRDRGQPERISGVEVVSIESWYRQEAFDKFQRNSPLNPFFREGFWLKAAERIFVLHQFQRKFNLCNFFHAELDVLILNLSGLDTQLESRGDGIYAPVQDRSRAIASLVFVRGFLALAELVEFLDQNSALGNEMKILGKFFSERPDIAHPILCESALPHLDSYAPSEGNVPDLVDGLGFGPWLFGYDSRNLNGNSFNHYKEKGLPVEFGGLRYRLIKKSGLGVFKGRRLVANLRTVHVHSKIFRRLRNPVSFRYLLWLAGLPFKSILSVKFSSLFEGAVKVMLSSSIVMLIKQAPRWFQGRYANLVLWQLARQRKVISNRERGYVVDMLPSGFASLATSKSQFDSIQPLVWANSNNLEGRIEELSESRRLEYKRELTIAPYLLELAELLAIVDGGHPVIRPLDNWEGKVPLVLSPIKRYQDFQHSQAFWQLPDSSYPTSFSAAPQVFNSDWIREMFPNGLSDVYAWADLALRAKAPSLSLAESYGNWVMHHKAREIRLYGRFRLGD